MMSLLQPRVADRGVTSDGPHVADHEDRPESASWCRLRWGGFDVIDLAVQLDGDGLGLAQVLVVFGLLRTGELEVGVGQLRHRGRLGVFIGL